LARRNQRAGQPRIHPEGTPSCLTAAGPLTQIPAGVALVSVFFIRPT
jgi:hypothetical protein